MVQSLAKWKRLALKRYGFYPGKGLYTDMNAIRRDEEVLDNLHSVYVDQWDWEKVILPENRNLDYLKLTVMDIVEAICDTQDTMQAIYPQLQCLGKLLFELKDLYRLSRFLTNGISDEFIQGQPRNLQRILKGQKHTLCRPFIR